MSGLTEARTFLFVPADRPDRFPKALASGADVVILDLEDAVDPARRTIARREASRAISEGHRLAVRVNSPGCEDGLTDLEELALASPVAVVIPRAERAADIDTVARALPGTPLVPLIETAAGLEAAHEIARISGVARLAFGAVDYTLDIGAEPVDEVLGYVRARLVVISRAAGIAAPIDTPSLELADARVVEQAARTARRFGMGGKLCIHPFQIPIVASVFEPSRTEISAARRLLAAANDDGAARIDDRMVDRPLLQRARQVLRSAGLES